MSITQETLEIQDNYLFIKHTLTNFKQTNYTENLGCNTVYLVGEIINPHPICPKCGQKVCHEESQEYHKESQECHKEPHVNINSYTTINLKHYTFGDKLTTIRLKRRQYNCLHCGHYFQDEIPFKAEDHFITNQLQHHIEDLLSSHMFTITAIHKLTSVHPSIIKDIDKHRLQQQYTSVYNEDGSLRYCYKVSKTNTKVRFLGIDEFSLHKHHKYATTIMDLETGEVLFVAYGRKKQVVYDFIEVANNEYSAELGEDFMKQVKAISSDMNSDYEEAFMEKCPHLKIVYDHFHIVKNFNEGVINKVKQDEYKRLWEAGKWKEADILKGSKYLLMANYDDLDQKGQDKVGQILAQNKLLLLADIVKEQLKQAYEEDTALSMMESIDNIITLCKDSENKHFLKFAKLLEEHVNGIITHATYRISTGKVEGTNNRIKAVRHQAYGFHDDEYFFLKILDMTIEK